MKTIRASDIGTYQYCRRAWWYRINGQESANQAELAAGTELHRKHGRAVFAAGMLRYLAWAVLLLALVLAAIYATGLLLRGA